jgi:hypothetical protein
LLIDHAHQGDALCTLHSGFASGIGDAADTLQPTRLLGAAPTRLWYYSPNITGSQHVTGPLPGFLRVVVQKTFGFPEARGTIALYQEPDSLCYRAET